MDSVLEYKKTGPSDFGTVSGGGVHILQQAEKLLLRSTGVRKNLHPLNPFISNINKYLAHILITVKRYQTGYVRSLCIINYEE
jgi:hypothetical protein